MRTACLIFVALVLATTVTAMNRRVVGNATPCSDAIVTIIEDVANAGEEIAKAVKVCGNSTRWETCATDVSGCAADLADAAKDVAKAVSACGGAGTKCATDIIAIGKDLASTSGDVFAALKQCHGSNNVPACVLDVLNIAEEVDKIAGHIKNALVACKK